MSAITGAKEREERREKFYSVQHGKDIKSISQSTITNNNYLINLRYRF